jgi:hypothetical protein
MLIFKKIRIVQILGRFGDRRSKLLEIGYGVVQTLILLRQFLLQDFKTNPCTQFYLFK